MKACLNRRS